MTTTETDRTTVTLPERWRIAADLVARNDLDLADAHVKAYSVLSSITFQVKTTESLRVGYGLLDNPQVTVREYEFDGQPCSIHVKAAGHYRDVEIEFYGSFYEPATLDLIRSLPADGRLLDALVGDKPKAA